MNNGGILFGSIKENLVVLTAKFNCLTTTMAMYIRIMWHISTTWVTW